MGDLHHIPALFFFFTYLDRWCYTYSTIFFTKWNGYFLFTKKTRDRIDNIYVTENNTTMTEEQYFSRLTAHYERFEDYDDEE